ncbi:S41 family peptidase [Flavobacterium sp.]|jgi:C-terminal processing protease CtpA/Prc|uniref:S41 family peptidase n=1 Tax=Flavobacterium sp. TaxID=239 RepID=UPI0037BE979D
MKPIFKYLLAFTFVAFTALSCQNEDEDDVAPPMNIEIQNFVWKGLNLYYLWQADVLNLSDTRFKNQTELNSFLTGYPKPEDLFNSLRVDKSIDRFSWIVDDYLVLEGQLQGTTNNNGVEFGLSLKASGSTEVVGWVQYIIPNSDASTKNIKRGDIFYAVNGTQLTTTNYQSLLFGSNNDYTLSMADISSGAIVPNGRTVALTKTVLDENPILVNTVINSGAKKIGYIMYNGFYSNFDTKLNDAFGTLKSQGITDLVLDLRYNGGGSVQTAARLASMITGGFTGQVFAKQQWNAKIESYFAANDPESLKNYFVDKIGTTPINSLNMPKVYILTSKSTASASELVINGLKPFISVIQIGDVTVGKNVGSVTLYDSPTFGKDKRNPNHRYAMQPLTLKIVNKDGFGDYQSGLTPTFSKPETVSNLGVLGNPSEPLLSLAIGKITGTAKIQKSTPQDNFEFFSDSKSGSRIQKEMYLEKAPEGLLKALE